MEASRVHPVWHDSVIFKSNMCFPFRKRLFDNNHHNKGINKGITWLFSGILFICALVVSFAGANKQYSLKKVMLFPYYQWTDFDCWPTYQLDSAVVIVLKFFKPIYREISRGSYTSQRETQNDFRDNHKLLFTLIARVWFYILMFSIILTLYTICTCSRLTHSLN